MPALGPRELGCSTWWDPVLESGLCPHTSEPVERVSHIASPLASLSTPSLPEPPRDLFCREASWPLLPLTLACADPQLCAACLPWEGQPGLASQIRAQVAPLASPCSPAPSAALPHPILPPRPLAHLPQAAWPLGSLRRTADLPGPPLQHTSPDPPVHCQAHPPRARPGRPEKAWSGGVTSLWPHLIRTLSPWQPLPRAPSPSCLDACCRGPE